MVLPFAISVGRVGAEFSEGGVDDPHVAPGEEDSLSVSVAGPARSVGCALFDGSTPCSLGAAGQRSAAS